MNIKQEVKLHDDLISLANNLLTDKPFLNTVKAKDYLDGAFDAAIEGNPERAYTRAVIGAHLFFNRGIR